MLAYILLLLIPFFFCVIAFQKKKQLILQGIHASKNVFQSINWSLPIFFIGMFLMLSLRHELIGNDTGGYKITFEYFRLLPLKSALEDPTEKLYILLNWGVGQITDNFQWFLAVVSAITLLPMFFLYNEEREYSFLKIILFVNMSTFIMMFSGIRQMLAVAMGVLAYFCARNKKWFWFLVMTAVAVGFHTSGIMILAIYPLYHASFRRRHLWIIVPIVALIIIFNEPIFLFLANNIYGAYTGETDMITTTETGAYTTLILFAVFAVFSYILPDEEKMTRETLAMRNILVFATTLQSFSLVHDLAMRMNYYFIIFIPIAMARILPCAKDEFKTVAKWAEGAIIIFFTIYFVYGLWTQLNAGVSTLSTIPYIPFWQD